MQCRQCGTQIAEKAIICYKCGTATDITEARPARRAGGSGGRALPMWVWALLLALVAAAAWWRFR